jgi:UDP-3-O-[3-hydroxymyristoyl] glucosamine N-acyltransferase
MEGQVYPKQNKDQLLVFVHNPRLEFTRIAKKINRNHSSPKVGISSSSVIAGSAKIGRDCYIGDHVVIGEDCIIGDNSKIESKVNLQNCIIGNDCIIQPNTTIGSDGFAFERVSDTL